MKIYNVLIGGCSIGLTFKLAEAQDWVRSSMFEGTKEIRAVNYTSVKGS